MSREVKIDSNFSISLEQFLDMKTQYEEILQKIHKIVKNENITGIEAKLMILEILDNLKEGNE